MTYSSLDGPRPAPDDGNYRAQQDHEAEKFAYIMEVIDRVRARTSTEQDIEYLEQELTPYSTHTRK